MLRLTKSEAIFLLDLLRELRNPDNETYPEEIDQAIEILEELVKRAPEGLVV